MYIHMHIYLQYNKLNCTVLSRTCWEECCYERNQTLNTFSRNVRFVGKRDARYETFMRKKYGATDYEELNYAGKTVN